MDDDGNGVLDRDELVQLVKKLITKDVEVRQKQKEIYQVAKKKI